MRTWNRGDLEEGYVLRVEGDMDPGGVRWQEIRLDGAGCPGDQDILAT